MKKLIYTIALFLTICTTPILAQELITGGGFEAGAFGGDWTESSVNFGTPICDLGSCGTGTGTGPNSGSFWTWFGGIGTFEEGSVSQSFTVPATGTTELTFQIENIVCDSPADFLEVLIDGTQVYLIDGSDANCGVLGYRLETIDVSALATPGVHTIEFHSQIFANNGGGSNFFVDDVSMIFTENTGPVGAAVPTMSQWGLFLFALVSMTLGMVFMYRMETEKAVAGMSMSASTSSSLPFNMEVFQASIKHALGLAVVGFALILVGWGEIVPMDLVGMMISIPVVAYMIHLAKMMKK